MPFNALLSLLLLVVLLSLSNAIATNSANRFSSCYVFKLNFTGASHKEDESSVTKFREWAKLQRADVVDVWSNYGDLMHVMVNAQQVNINTFQQMLQQLNIQFEVVQEDVQEVIDTFFDSINKVSSKVTARKRKRAPFYNIVRSSNDDWEFFENYHTFDAIRDYSTLLSDSFANIAEVIVVGNTTLKKDMIAIKISTKANGAINKPSIVINACQHAREWIGPSTAMFIAQSLLTNFTHNVLATELMEFFDIYVIPVVNIDGYEYTWTTNRLWRKNRHQSPDRECVGTDLNRNWAYKWGGVGASNDSCSNEFHGDTPFAEAETSSFANWMQQLSKKSKIVGYVDLHSFSQLILYPYAFTAEDHVGTSKEKDVGEQVKGAIFNVHNKNYKVGDWYTALYPSTGTSIDYMYHEHGTIYSYTWELRDRGPFGFLLPPNQIIPTGQEIWAGAQVLMNNIMEDCKTTPSKCFFVTEI